jgi:digeranylgeranylglycerophospholipid reductase
VLDVRGTYRHLAGRARARGAEIRTGAKADAPLVEGGRVVGCVVEGEELRSRVVVDASGYRAAISKRAGLHPGYTRFGVGAEFELLAPRCDQQEALLVVGERWAPAGYAWVFPWGGERVRVGVGVHHADVRADPKEHLELFRDEAARFRVDLSEARETEYHFGLVPAESMPSRLAGDGIVCAGDAACQATLVVGEGIRLAMTAGWMAGVAAANALAQGRADREALAHYEREFRRRYGLNLRVGGIMNRRLAGQDDAGWDEKIRLLSLVPRELVPRLLLSEFRLGDLARGLALQPRLWPQVYRYWIRPRLRAA